MLVVRYNWDGRWGPWKVIHWESHRSLLSGTSWYPQYAGPGKHLQHGGGLVDVVFVAPD